MLLEDISPIGCDINGNPLLRREEYFWLLEQAEKAEKYKIALENIEALEFFTNFSDKEKIASALYHAKSALKDSE